MRCWKQRTARARERENATNIEHRYTNATGQSLRFYSRRPPPPSVGHHPLLTYALALSLTYLPIRYPFTLSLIPYILSLSHSSEKSSQRHSMLRLIAAQYGVDV
jgi:hypothetical protein